jgi:hypothetical protein
MRESYARHAGTSNGAARGIERGPDADGVEHAVVGERLLKLQFGELTAAGRCRFGAGE